MISNILVILYLRTWALWNHNKHVAVFLLIFAVTALGGAIGVWVKSNFLSKSRYDLRLIIHVSYPVLEFLVPNSNISGFSGCPPSHSSTSIYYDFMILGISETGISFYSHYIEVVI